MDIELTAAQVAEIAVKGGNAHGFGPRQVQYWTSEGILKAVDPDATRHRRYASVEAIIARACARWASCGVTTPALLPISGTLRRILASRNTSQTSSIVESRYEKAKRQLNAAVHGGAEAVVVFYCGPSNAPQWDVISDNTVPLPEWPASFVMKWRALMGDI